MKCYDCDKEFTAETADEILNQMYQHYMADHKEIIEGIDESQKDAWMKQFHKDFESTENI